MFDTGLNTTFNMFLTIKAGGAPGPRFAATTGGNKKETQVNAASAVPTNQWAMLAVSVVGNTGTLSINGKPVGTTHDIDLSQFDVRSAFSYLGKSQYNDPLLSGQMDEFLMLGRGLSDAEILKYAKVGTP